MCDLFNSFDWVMLLECGYDECPDGSSLTLHSDFCAGLHSARTSTLSITVFAMTTFSETDIFTSSDSKGSASEGDYSPMM